MLLKSSLEEPVKVFFLTRPMLETLVSQSIPLQDLEKISAYHQKLSVGEIAAILKLQYEAADRLSVKLPEPENFFSDDIQGKLLKQAFNGLNSEALVEAIRNTKHFSSIGVGDLVILLLLDEEEEVTGWSPLSNRTFSSALLEAIFSKVGYLDTQFTKVVEANEGEFSLAHVYRLVGIEATN